MTRDQIDEHLRNFLITLFDVPAQDITPGAHLFDDLGLDSIDAVDLMVSFQDLTGIKIPPAEFKSVRTVSDVVDAVHARLGA